MTHSLKIRAMVATLVAIVLVLAGCTQATKTTTSPAPTSPTSTVTAAPTTPITVRPTSPTTSAPPTTTITTTRPTSPPATTTAAAPSGTLTFAVSSFGFERFYAPKSDGTAGYNYIGPVLEQLVNTPIPFLGPWLADKWEITPDGLAWIFSLHKGVKWHDGTDFTAADVKFSLEKYSAKDAYLPAFGQLIKDIQVVDAYTVRVNTNGRQAFMPLIAVNTTPFMIPKGYVEKNGEEFFEQKPVGTGPFKFVRRMPGDMVEFEAFDQYWQGAPAFKTLRVLLIPETTTQLATLRTGEVDGLMIGAEEAAALEKAGFRTFLGRGATDALFLEGAMLPEGAKHPISDVRVRQALSLAINRDEIIKSFFYGKARASNVPGVFPVSADVNIDSWTKYAANLWRYDPVEAKKLLTEAGYANGFNMTITTYKSVGGGDMPKLSEVIAGYWAKVGVKASINVVDKAIADKLRNTLKFPDFIGQAVTGDRSETPTVAVSLASIFHSTAQWAIMGKTKPEVDQLIDTGRTDTDPAKRAAALEKVLKTVSDSYLQLSLVDEATYFALGPRVDINIPTGSISLAKHAGIAKHRTP